MFLRNYGSYKSHTASHPRRRHCSHSEQRHDISSLLSIMYDIISLANSTVLTVDNIPARTNKSVSNHNSRLPFHRTVYMGLLGGYDLCSIGPPLPLLNLTYVLILLS
jgi:hypothetical protein